MEKSLKCVVLLLLAVLEAGAQTAMPVEFSYDAAGNRTVRKVLPLPSKARSAGLVDTSYYTDKTSSVRMRIFPNPTEGRVWVELQCAEGNATWSAKVFDAKGRRLAETEGAGCRAELDLSPYPRGNYIVEFYVKGERTVWKVVKGSGR